MVNFGIFSKSIRVKKMDENLANPTDDTAKLICSLLSLFYSMQTGIKSAPANDNFNFEGGDDDDAA